MLRSFASSSARAVRTARAVRFNSTQAEAPQQSVAYIVERTANGTLPVYSDIKGNAVRTIIRRVRGSAEVSHSVEGRDARWNATVDGAGSPKPGAGRAWARRCSVHALWQPGSWVVAITLQAKDSSRRFMACRRAALLQRQYRVSEDDLRPHLRDVLSLALYSRCHSFRVGSFACCKAHGGLGWDLCCVIRRTPLE